MVVVWSYPRHLQSKRSVRGLTEMVRIHRCTFLTSKDSHQFTLHVEDVPSVCTLSSPVMAVVFRPTVSVQLYLFGFPVAFRRNGIRFRRLPLPADTSIDVAIALLPGQMSSGLLSSPFHRCDEGRWVLYSGQAMGRNTVSL
jgi:hypothetical protein